ncbi:MAG: hypothetical protein QF893_02840 [Alphaproteobacteria bacterium]|nr:hypothetical protein [Alphaproteobacteria bacterium]
MRLLFGNFAAGRFATGVRVRPPRQPSSRLGRRAVALIATLSLCLNALLPSMVAAMVAGTGFPVVICTPNGYETIRLDESGTPQPSPQQHEGAACTLCVGCGQHVGSPSCVSVVAPVEARNAVQPRIASGRRFTVWHSSYARGPPHLA